MNWNHRVVNCPSENGGDDYFAFKEVYYDDQDRPDAYSDPFMAGDDMDGLHELIARLNKAMTRPVLHENDFKGD
jgi:hypothetical protein